MFLKRRSPNQSANENQPRPKKKPNWFKISIIVNVMVFVLIAAGTASSYVLHESDTNPQFCGACHVMQNNVNSYLTGQTLDHVHEQAGVQCKECHDYSVAAEIESGIKYITGNYSVISEENQTLPKQKYSDEMCLKCHISNSYIVAQTDFLVKNPHLSHWDSLHCSNCHISHGEQVDYCNTCHINGGQRLTGSPIVPRAENPWATGNGPKDAPEQ